MELISSSDIIILGNLYSPKTNLQHILRLSVDSFSANCWEFAEDIYNTKQISIIYTK